MTKSRDVFEIPHTGEKFTFTKRPADTNGELLEIEFLVKQFFPPAHIHADLEERVEVLAGRARVRAGSKEWTAGPGETVVFPQARRTASAPKATRCCASAARSCHRGRWSRSLRRSSAATATARLTNTASPTYSRALSSPTKTEATSPARPSGSRSLESPRSPSSPGASAT